MKSVEEIFKAAQRSSRIHNGRNAMDHGAYNTGYMLSHEHIQASALLKISNQQNISLQEAAKQYYIDGISCTGADFGKAAKSKIDDYFGETINNAVNSIQSSGKPAFFSVDANNHFAMVALIPNSDTGKLSILYLNSIAEGHLNHAAAKKEFMDTLRGKEFGVNENNIQELKTEFIDTIDTINEQQFQDLQMKFAQRAKQFNPSLEVELLQAQLVNLRENIVHTQKLSKVGKDFADALIDNLKAKGIQLESDKVINKSQDQQLANCCGLSVASNIADVSSHVASKKSY